MYASFQIPRTKDIHTDMLFETNFRIWVLGLVADVNLIERLCCTSPI